MEFEYDQHGTLAYFGAYDVHRAQLIGRIAPTTGIAPFTELVEQVMRSEPFGPSVLTWGWCPPRTPRGRPAPRAGSPRPATLMPAGC